MRHLMLQDGGHLCAVHLGHGQVQENQIGVEALGLTDSIQAINSLTADFDFFLIVKETSNNAAHTGTVICN